MITFLDSPNLDSHGNLAVEECLLGIAERAGPFLFTWRSRPAVVVGKNQNPWRETNPDFLRREGVALARRISGGGAVYHDEGNLNFALFQDRREYRQDAFYDMVLLALRNVGIPAERMGKSSLAVSGKKISGNAFCYRGNSVLHHGTLLLSANLEKLHAALRPHGLAIQTRAVASEPAKVANLTEFSPSLDAPMVRASLADAFGHHFGGAEERDVLQLLEERGFEETRRRFSSWEWIYGHTPPFDVELQPGTEGCPESMKCSIRKGRVQALECSPAHPWNEELAAVLVGVPFAAQDLAHASRLSPGHDALARWFETQAF